jgi:DNA-binding transcriptional LysR family regulator
VASTPALLGSRGGGWREARSIRDEFRCLQQSLEPTQFDPSKAIRRFRIAVDNYSAVVLVGILAARIGRIAPHVLLEFQPSGTLEILDLLDRGELDLAIGPHSAPGEPGWNPRE